MAIGEGSFLTGAAVFLGAAVVAVPIFKRLGLGSVIGYLVAGAAIGPFGLALIEGAEEVLHFAEFGVVLLLFIIGLENPSFKEQIAAFKRDHDRHFDELRSLASTVGVVPPTEGDAKQRLTTGKVALASLMGDKTILRAMKTNEDNTVTAYERASRHEQAPADAKPMFERALADERRHREWIETTAEQL